MKRFNDCLNGAHPEYTGTTIRLKCDICVQIHIDRFRDHQYKEGPIHTSPPMGDNAIRQQEMRGHGKTSLCDHLSKALDAAENEQTKYHLREAYQKAIAAEVDR